MKKLLTIASLVLFSSSNFAHAASFTINSGETATTTKTLDGASEIGTINSGGALSTTANSTTGVLVTGANVQVINNGLISTTGTSSSAIVSGGANTTITNSGTISVTGSNSIAIDLDNAGAVDSTLTNTGTISASGSATRAIFGGSGAQTVILGKGSRIIGSVDLQGGASDSITVTGNGISGRLVTSNVETLTINAGVAGTITNGGNTIHTIDPTSVASLTIGANNLSKTIGETVNSRVSKNQIAKGEEDKVWTKIFGSQFERGDDGQNLSYDHDYNGVVVGYEYDKRFGVVLGVSNGQIKTDSQSFKSDVNSVFIGAYKGFKLADSTFLNTNLIAGYEKYKNKRDVVDNVNGIQTARSDVNNLFITPSIEVEHRVKLNEMFEVRPNASASYTSSFFGSSNETGTTASNIAIESRNARVLNLKAGISGLTTIMKNYQVNAGFGLDSRRISEDRASATVASTGFKFATNNNKNVTGRYLDLGLNFVGFKDLELGFNANIRSASGSEDQRTVALNANYRF